jgi:hypothetical protein
MTSKFNFFLITMHLIIIVSAKNSVICRETAKSRHRHLIIRILLGIYSIGTYILLGITSIMFCLSTAISVIYAIFIAFIYSLCDLMQDRCFDMSELLPAFADRFTKSVIINYFILGTRKYANFSYHHRLTKNLHIFWTAIIFIQFPATQQYSTVIVGHVYASDRRKDLYTTSNRVMFSRE